MNSWTCVTGDCWPSQRPNNFGGLWLGMPIRMSIHMAIRMSMHMAIPIIYTCLCTGAGEQFWRPSTRPFGASAGLQMSTNLGEYLEVPIDIHICDGAGRLPDVKRHPHVNTHVDTHVHTHVYTHEPGWPARSTNQRQSAAKAALRCAICPCTCLHTCLRTFL